MFVDTPPGDCGEQGARVENTNAPAGMRCRGDSGDEAGQPGTRLRLGPGAAEYHGRPRSLSRPTWRVANSKYRSAPEGSQRHNADSTSPMVVTSSRLWWNTGTSR